MHPEINAPHHIYLKRKGIRIFSFVWYILLPLIIAFVCVSEKEVSVSSFLYAFLLTFLIALAPIIIISLFPDALRILWDELFGKDPFVTIDQNHFHFVRDKISIKWEQISYFYFTGTSGSADSSSVVFEISFSNRSGSKQVDVPLIISYTEMEHLISLYSQGKANYRPEFNRPD